MKGAETTSFGTSPGARQGPTVAFMIQNDLLRRMWPKPFKAHEKYSISRQSFTALSIGGISVGTRCAENATFCITA
jgi:hypothetical protein